MKTRLKLKNPINPQLIAPIITKVKTIASNVLTVIPPLYIKFFTVLTNNMLINYTYIHKLNFLIDFYIFYSYNSTWTVQLTFFNNLTYTIVHLELRWIIAN